MGGAGGRIGELVARLARRHEERLRRSLAEALERAVEEVDAPLRRGIAAVAIDRSAVPPGTLSHLARAIVVASDHRVPLREPGELVRT
jgi:hypothetical protein